MKLQKNLVALSLVAVMAAGLAAPMTGSAGNTAAAEPNYSAMSIEQLEKLIAKLQVKLAEMKKGSACFVSDKDLSIGDGEDDGLTKDVKRLQSFLKEKGFFSYGVTGYFGKATRDSLKKFQAAQGISQTGEFNAATRTKVGTLTCKTATSVKSAEKKEVKEEKQEVKDGVVTSISATADGDHVKWSVSGYSKNGFKVVWSKEANPTYPNREGDRYQYFSEPTRTSSEKLEAFDGAGTYYVRVCEYLGGSCGKYSNSVTVSLE